MTTFDGSINIDTRVDTKGIKKGTASISNGLSGVLASVKKIGAALGLAFSGAAVLGFFKKLLGSVDLMGSAVGGQIKELKDSFNQFKSAFASALLTLFSALAPYIIQIVGWLTRMLLIVTALISALFGVKAVTAGIKDDAKDTAKEAKGQLAAFDQINVLDDEKKAESLPGVEIPADVLTDVENFKNKMLDLLQPLIDSLGRLWEALKPLGETIWQGLKWAWDNILVPLGEWVITDLLPAFLDLLASALGVLNEMLIAFAPSAESFFEDFLKPLAEWAGAQIIQFLEWLTIKLDELAVWIKENPEKFRTFATILGIIAIAVVAVAAGVWLVVTAISVWNTVVAIASGIASGFAVVMGLITSPIFLIVAALGVLVVAVIGTVGWFLYLKNNLTSILEFIKSVWGKAGDWFFENVTEPIQDAFSFMLKAVKSAFISTFDFIQDFVKGVVNNIISNINSMIDSVLGGINSAISAANALGELTGGGISIPTLSVPSLPQLATGAVIPPNAQFAAILGDQRNGTNIEAPADLIRSILREELAAGGGGGSREITIKIEGGNMAQLVRLLKPELDKEDKRRGVSLVTSGG